MKAKRILAVFLAAGMVLGLTACMQKDKAQGKDGGTSKKGTTVSDDIMAAYKDPVAITTVMPENAGITWQKGESYDKNPWYDAYKKRFNIQVKNEWVSNDYTTKLNLAIASGDIPDVFVATNEQLDQLHDAGIIWDLSEIYDKYASDSIKKYMKQESDTFETAKFDGKLYGIPQLSYGIIDQPNQIWIRNDWKEELNLPDPKTMDDVLNIGRAFMKKHGGYAMTEDQNLDCMKMMAPAWGAHPDIWITQTDGKVGYGSVQPQMKDVLSNYAKLYKEGFINPDFTITDSDKMQQAVISGEVGVNPYYQWWGYTPGPDVITNLGPDGIFYPYAIPSANGQPVKASIDFSNYGYVVVSKKCKNPEAVMKLLDFYVYMMDDAHGKESQDFINSLYNNAYSNIPYALRVINPMHDYDLFNGVKAAVKKGLDTDVTDLGPGAVKYENTVDWMKNKTPKSVGDFLQMGGEKTAYGISQKMLDEGDTVKNVVWGRKPKTLLSAGSTLDDLLKEGFTKIIVGEQPVNYFDQLVADWNKAGGEKATKEVNEMYGKQQK